MQPFKPYTYIQCPCTDASIPSYQLPSNSSTKQDTQAEDEEEGQTFDPRAPRSNYSLYPLEHLLYCEDCHEIRCPKCVLDEIVTCYCPNCLFEVPSSTVKSEGNRCTRSCFQCPICVAPLSVSSVEPPSSGLGADLPTSHAGPYILNCGYCNWSSKEINITFEKPNGISSQLARVKNGGEPLISHKDRQREKRKEFSSPLGAGVRREELPSIDEKNERLDAENQFASLRSFYQGQLAEVTPASLYNLGVDLGFSSPGTLTRIMGLYTGSSLPGGKSARKKADMREALDATEGLQVFDPIADENAVKKLHTDAWAGTSSTTQREEQLVIPHPAKFVDELRPVAMVLRTKRSKRCKTCRHILSKPEAKVQTTRFKIRLVAHNYLPNITIARLSPNQTPQSGSVTSDLLQPLRPVQFLLHFHNPLFESVKISIATPSRTSGRFPSEVAILCPSFDIGANTDAWDEALGSSKDGSSSLSGEKRRTREERVGGQDRVAEAGKVWERGRNWVSIVVEVVPASLRHLPLGKESGKELILEEDEDLLEIPVFVRVEWESEGAADEAGGLAAGKGEKEKRELAYWAVLGLGRIEV